MIVHKDIPSEFFEPANDLILVKPRALPRGEVKSDAGIVVAMEQNTSVVDRETLGKIIKIGKDIDQRYKDKTIIWVQQDGIELELQDGLFKMLQQKSILGTIENIDVEIA